MPMIEEKKDEVLDRLSRIAEKMRRVDMETRFALLTAMELKEAGDDIADQVMILIAELARIRSGGNSIDRPQTESPLCVHER
jgi:hypothetical protein